MQLGLRAKLTMVMAGLVLLSTAVLSLVFAELLLQQEIRDADKRANELASETFDSARRALEDARGQGLRPASESPLDTHDYVAHAFEMSEGLAARLQTAIDSPYSIVEATIVDRDNVVLISSSPADLRSGFPFQAARRTVRRGAHCGFHWPVVE